MATKSEEARTALGKIQDSTLCTWDSTPSTWDPYEVWRTRILPMTHTEPLEGSAVAPRINQIKLATPGDGCQTLVTKPSGAK